MKHSDPVLEHPYDEADRRRWQQPGSDGPSAASKLESREGLAAIASGAGDVRGIALDYLEADPWYHGSGYTKESVARAFRKAARLSPDDYARLARLVIRAVEHGAGREIGAYQSIARHLGSHTPLAELQRLAKHPVPAVRRRASWMLGIVSKSQT